MQRGFSLVELAIVLVIIGLITGGILTGQDLIRASEMNSVVADMNKYKTAVNTFRIKYNALPGDIRNATSYWSTAAGNGNGDGTYTWSTEGYYAWNHLSLSGIISGNYTGIAAGSQSVIGTNVPASRIANAGYSFVFEGAPNISGAWDGLVIGSPVTLAYTYGGTVISAAEANSIDAKADDGLPGVGNVRTLSSGYWACVTGSGSTSAYALTTSGNNCGLYFSLQLK